jgi:hypothetical protein
MMHPLLQWRWLLLLLLLLLLLQLLLLPSFLSVSHNAFLLSFLVYWLMHRKGV